MLFNNKKIQTAHGELITPFFMPDATRGFIKMLDVEKVENAGIEAMVVNTLHLYLRPGMETIKKAGGIHKFMGYTKPLLSDSGGYQVFSLIHKNGQGCLMEDGAEFYSPLDGSKHFLTPEKSIQIQFDLGVDMMVCFDEPAPNFYSRKKIEMAMQRTVRWSERCLVEYKKQLKERKISGKKRPLLFCVVQGGPFVDLREKCVLALQEVAKKHNFQWDGYGFGGRHIDEKGNLLKDVLQATAEKIPNESLKFALGIGRRRDIVEAIKYGWEMFDCVIPTREGRHGRVLLKKGGKINMGNGVFKNDFSPPDKNCSCPVCQKYSRAYLHHLFKHNDPLGMSLLSEHNLFVYREFFEEIR